MEYIYSNADPELLTHIIWHKADFINYREEIVPPEEFIQCAALCYAHGTTFKPHRHVIRKQVNPHYNAQEAWVVISGAVTFIMYDIDDTELGKRALIEGDAAFTLHGGHNYIVHGDSLVYEFKTGPYLGQKLDKEFINV